MQFGDGEFPGENLEIPRISGRGTGTNMVYNSRTGRGGESSVAKGNFEVYPRKITEIRGGDGDNNFEEITHSSKDVTKINL